MSVSENLLQLRREIPPHVQLIAVSKTKPISDIQEAYDAGQRAFGENYVQEVSDKQQQLPTDIKWHFIGHLQSNKVKYLAPFVDWIHGVESEKLLVEINKQAAKHQRVIRCLLQVHIATEESKFGFDAEEVLAYCKTTDFSQYPNVLICGLMGMASFTEDISQIRNEFRQLKNTFDQLKTLAFQHETTFAELSMGMSGDWKIAVEEGSTMIRVGSAIFGNRNYTTK
ncbi:MAG: YggS family pyridoxal phosphate-dependent enzyme [Flavobacteriales bacterium]|nr:YggS family pyridoxal phosphate-dependent enzyme [Flavobacteriales bacterium]